MTRKFQFETLLNDEVQVVTVTERDIWNKYLPQWLNKKLNEKGLEYKWSFQECIDDFLNDNWGWEVKE